MIHSLYEMSNISSKKTGLNMIIWISTKSNSKHRPRIKVQQEYGDKVKEGKWFSMTIDNNPKIIGKIGEIKISDIAIVKQFVILNKELLLKHWNSEITSDTAIDNFIKTFIDREFVNRIT